MNRYKITARSVSFGTGQTLQLEPKQVEPRRHNLKVISADDKAKLVTVEVLNTIQFKAGEIVRLPALERRLEKDLEALDAPPPAETAPAAAEVMPTPIGQPVTVPDKSKRTGGAK